MDERATAAVAACDEIAAIFKAAGDEEINGADLVDEVGRILRKYGILDGDVPSFACRALEVSPEMLDGVERSVPCWYCGAYGYHETDCELMDRDPEEE